MILGTCVTTIEHQGKLQKARALIDNGSGLSFITTKLTNTLGLRKIAEPTSIVAFQQASTPLSKFKVDFTLRVPSGSVTTLMPIRALVVDTITGDLPAGVLISVRQDPCLKELKLADPNFDKPGRVDLLLGVDVLPRIMREKTVRSTNQLLSASETIYGWVVSGQCQSDKSVPRSHICLSTQTVDEQTQDLLTKFWQVEDVSSNQVTRTKDEQLALDHFERTHSRQPDGRYVVELPRKTDALSLGCSRDQAQRRHLQNQKSLTRRGKWTEFQEALDDYAIRKHSERVPASDLLKPESDSYYLPTHGVVKESSTTTKLRVVFDASACTSSGISLNDQLLPGPNLYSRLTNILVSFRQHRIGMTADIGKMFREIALAGKEKDFHRYLITNKDGLIEDWRMCRLTFGVTSSPFLATQVLRQVASDHGEEFPVAADIIESELYVDDCITGAETLEEAVDKREQTNGLLRHACMDLRKWRTNDPRLLATIPEDLREKETTQLIVSPSDCHKTLGIHWNAASDTLHVSTPAVVPIASPTKRQITSEVARVFDLLGWFAPAIVVLKMLLQSLWKLGMTWDEPVPDVISTAWRTWQAEQQYITNHPIPRCYYDVTKEKRSIQLHGFSDASNAAYGGVVYVRTMYQDTTVSVSLVISKTKVAPISPSGTTPRLELCGAQVLSKLLSIVMESLDIELQDVFAWSDSTIVLCWLHMPPGRLNTYVSNRVGDTLTRIPCENWRHVPTETNPADLASRGVSPRELSESKLWWQGPEWLLKGPEDWPNLNDWRRKNDNLPELRNTTLIVGPPAKDLITRFSSHKRMLRVLTWCRRFALNSRKQPNERLLSSTLTLQEIQTTEIILLRQSQERFFQEEITCLKSNQELSRKSSLLQRRPFLDSDQLLRVGGRLRRTDLAIQQKHPLILHRKDYLTELIGWQTHRDSLHVGPTGLMGILSTAYHILGAKALTKQISKGCVKCQRFYARTTDQLMGQLPPCRATPAPPFTTTGADFAGPFTLRKGHTRKPVWISGYVCLFVCLTTKSVHLELVMDLTSEAFLAALRRFIARRGRPTTFFTDNGTNFVGARRELEAVYRLLDTPEASESLSQFLTDQRITWKHSPARSPHFGGIWEAGIKQMKTLLFKTLGTQKLTAEDMYTILTEVEAILNSRPLVPLDSTPIDGAQVLTPGHFLVGRSLKALPHTLDTTSKITSLRRWNLCKRLTQDLWRKWSQDYLQLLQKFQRWKYPKRSVRVGDVVLLKDSELFLRSWPLAVVDQVHPGEDGLVRVATLRTSKGLYKRSVTRLVPLLDQERTTVSLAPEDVQV